MARIIARDTFDSPNNTNLESHVPELGGMWTRHGYATSLIAFIHSRSVAYIPGASRIVSSIYTLGETPVADLYVQANFFSFVPPKNYRFGLIGRVQNDWSTYVELYPRSTNTFTLREVGGGSVDISATFIVGMNVKLDLSGTTAKAYFNGVYGGEMEVTLGAGLFGFSMKKQVLT
jgi:hypothetical protein